MSKSGGAPIKDTVVDLQILLDPEGGTVEGFVLDQSGGPLPGGQGLLLPDPLPQVVGPRHRKISVDGEGRFTVQGIAPGEWKVYIWEDVGQLEYFDPELLRRSSVDAAPVRIDAGSRISIRVEALSRP